MAQMDPNLAPTAKILSFLANYTFEQVVVGKDMLVTLGRAGAIEQLIDRVRKGGDTQFYDNACGQFNDNTRQPTEVGRLDITAILSTLLPMLPGDLGSKMPKLPPGQGLGTCSIRQDHSMLLMARISTSEIRSLVQAISVLMMPSPGAMPAGKNHPNGMPSRPSRAPDEF